MTYGHTVTLEKKEVGALTVFLGNLNFSTETEGISPKTICLRKYTNNIICVFDKDGLITVKFSFQTEDALEDFKKAFKSST